MADLVERYILLGLRLGRHVEGLVDAYYGPQRLAEAVDAEPVAAPAALVEEADALREHVEDGWLGDQLRGLRMAAGIVAGERHAYADEVEACYGVRPQRVSEDVFAAAHERLDEILPPGGSLRDRYEAWRDAARVPDEQIRPLLGELVRELRERTERLFGLPPGESLVLETVRDEPWLAFNYYLGGLRSRVVVNLDLPISAGELVELAAHETYPGHHTEHAWKEQLHVRERGFLAESILLVPTPAMLVSEGIAETAVEVLLDRVGREAVAAILRDGGVEWDVPKAIAVRAARLALRAVSVNAALLLHEQGVSEDEARDYVERWSLVAPEYAAHSVRFLTDPTWRAYVITYSAGGQLCRGYHRGEPQRYRRLLTEYVRVGELLAAAAEKSAVSSRP